MQKLKISDGTLSIEVKAVHPVSITSDTVSDILYQIEALNDLLPMSSYAIGREGATDVWTASATAKDARVYATTVTIAGGVAKYTLTSLIEGTDAEILAFLTLAQLFAQLLKVHEIETVEITWA